MPELNVPSCPTHGTPPRSLHTHNFAGIVQAAEAIIETVSGVGTVSYSRCPYGYGYNFEGVVRVLEDLNTTISGIQGGGAGDIAAGSGIYFTASGSATVINASIVSASGLSIAGGSGIYLTQGGSVINVNYQSVYDEVISGQFLGDGAVTVTYSGDFVLISGTDTQGGGGGGASVTVSGDPGTGYSTGDLWFDTNEGRLFVYASGGTVSDPAWYQTNAEAIATKGEVPPSGTGLNAPPRDGSIWFNNLLGSLFIYDAATSGWYETGPSRSFAYGSAAPAPSTEGAGWYSTADSSLKVWDGTNWTPV
jgi:hypothetical protein